MKIWAITDAEKACITELNSLSNLLAVTLHSQCAAPNPIGLG